MAGSVIDNPATGTTAKLGVTRILVAGAVTAMVSFVLCWLATFVPFSSPTHAYVALFTAAPAQSVTALAEGGSWSLLFGGLIGGLFAFVYNCAASLDRR